MDGTMISGRQYYEIPPAGQAITTSYKGNRRFDPDYGLNYGHHSYAIEQKDYRAARAVSGSGLGPAGARQSLSALDDKRANEIRHGVYAHVFLDVKNSSKSEAPNPRPLQHKRRASAAPAASNYILHDGNRLRVPGRFAPRPAIAASVSVPSSPLMTASHGPAPAYFGAPELYHHKGEQQQSTMATMATTEPARSSPRIARVPYALQTAPLDSKLICESLPTTALNRPRKLSQASTITVTSINSPRESFETRSRSSSYGSHRTSIDSSPTMWRPDYLYSRPSQTTVFRKKAKPGEIFAKLPGEVLELILGELKKLHLEKPTDSCATCWMRDVCSLTLTARKWCKFARVALYEDIQLVGADSASQKKRHKVTFGSRMMLLRRTLRANSYLAGLVHTLKVPSPPTGVLLEDYHNQVAALIMACPDFERLIGLHPHYNHSYSKLLHALSSRKRLKHMDWIVEPSPFQRQHRFKSSSGSNVAAMTQATYDASVTPGDLQPHQSAAFLDFHLDWAHLTTLSIHCLPGATLTPDNLISSALMHLTSLQHLYLSWMPVTAFNDSTLLSLPPLRTLSLTHVPGVTSSGISALATLPTSQAIQKLTLRHTNLDSLPALARIFSNFTHLEAFTLVQTLAPMLPEDTFIWLMPYLASSSLRKLHWDITSNTTHANAADSILARSIAADGFPSLRSLRSPNDPEGIFQALCRPQERTDSASDRFRGPNGPARSSSFPTPSTTHSPVSPTKPSRSPTAPASPVMSDTPRECTNLHVSRLAAQARLEAARAALPRFFLNVIDEDGTVLEKYGLAAFIGTVESRITYNLRPDPGAKDERGGLVELADLTADNGEEIAVGREGCQGRWNASSTVSDKKDRERWWHTERGRWQQPELA